jgi:hypothetical protein
MKNIGKAMLAGFVATVALSVLMVIKAMMGIMPELDIAEMLAKMMGSPDAPILGWVGHFMIGTIGYGIAFSYLAGRLPGSFVVQGVIVGILGWMVMMIVVMPMAGAGLFGLNFGIMAPMMTLMLHIIFGAVLGWTFSRGATQLAR